MFYRVFMMTWIAMTTITRGKMDLRDDVCDDDDDD